MTALTIHATISTVARRSPAKVAIDFEDRRVTYADLVADSRRLAAALSDGLGLARGDRVGVALSNRPEFYTAILAISRAGLSRALTPLAFGGSVVLHRTFDAERAVRDLTAGQVTATFMVPTMFSSISELPAARRSRHRGALQTILSNASALPEHLKTSILEQWPEVRLFEIYGSTEGGAVTALRPEDQWRKTRCVGQPLAFNDVALLDPAGDPVAAGEVGILYSRSPFAFSGYYGKPEATAEAFRDGFVTVGDLARQDDEGPVGRTPGRT